LSIWQVQHDSVPNWPRFKMKHTTDAQPCTVNVYAVTRKELQE
jgi:hypothetical protein